MTLFDRLRRHTLNSLSRAVIRRLRRAWNFRWYFMLPSAPTSIAWNRRAGGAISTIPSGLRARCIADAEAILLGHRECFGAIVISPGESSWDTDFVSGHRWLPGQFYQSYVLIDGSNRSDIKVPWELSRCHHLLPLAKAYQLTGDLRYAGKVESEILDWIACNPFAKSVNWTSAMEVAIRAVNWIWALNLCESYFLPRRGVLDEIHRSLFRHAIFVRSNLEKNVLGFSSNHYYANLVGLIYLGLHFRERRKARRWLHFALREFCVETRAQFHASGPNVELSTSYHRLVTEMLLSVICRLREFGRSLPTDVISRAREAIEYVYSYTRPDGSVPLFGDADDGRLHIFGRYSDWDRNSHQHLLALGHALFGETRWRQCEEHQYEDAAFLLGDGSVFSLASSPEPLIETKAYMEAGMYFMRQGNSMLSVKSSNKGAYETAGWHTHNDVLSFEFVSRGVPFFVDPGVGNYSGDIDERNMFRSTRMHNVVMIDGFEQNSLRLDARGLWDNGGEAQPSFEKWETGPDQDLLVCSHRGYARLASPLVHRRVFRFEKNECVLELQDWFEGEGFHLGEWHFILHPAVVPTQLGDSQWMLESGGQAVRCESNVRLELTECWYSPSYKRKVRTHKLRGHYSIHNSCVVVTRIAGVTR